MNICFIGPVDFKELLQRQGFYELTENEMIIAPYCEGEHAVEGYDKFANLPRNGSVFLDNGYFEFRKCMDFNSMYGIAKRMMNERVTIVLPDGFNKNQIETALHGSHKGISIMIVPMNKDELAKCNEFLKSNDHFGRVKIGIGWLHCKSMNLTRIEAAKIILDGVEAYKDRSIDTFLHFLSLDRNPLDELKQLNTLYPNSSLDSSSFLYPWIVARQEFWNIKEKMAMPVVFSKKVGSIKEEAGFLNYCHYLIQLLVKEKIVESKYGL